MFKKPVTIHIQASLTWQVAKDPESGMYVAVCPTLNLNALGETFEELFHAAGEAMHLLFQDLFETGELQQFLHERGWRPVTSLPTPGTRVRFDVPFNLEQRSAQELAGIA